MLCMVLRLSPADLLSSCQGVMGLGYKLVKLFLWRDVITSKICFSIILRKRSHLFKVWRLQGQWFKWFEIGIRKAFIFQVRRGTQRLVWFWQVTLSPDLPPWIWSLCGLQQWHWLGYIVTHHLQFGLILMRFLETVFLRDNEIHLLIVSKC